MSLENKLMKNSTIINKMIDETTLDDMDWVFIGTGVDGYYKKNIFMSFVNLYGAKNLIIEVLMYKDKHKNKILIYMENSKTNDVLPLKEIKYNENIIKLCLKILDSVKKYFDDEEFLTIYNKLKSIYQKQYNFIDFLAQEEEDDDDYIDHDAVHNSYMNYKEEIAKLLYKKGDKTYWDNYVKSDKFDDYVDIGWKNQDSPKKVVDEIHKVHKLN